MPDHVQEILSALIRFGALDQRHSDQTLFDHLRGTYQILLNWESERPLCLAGLCHSIYGTESHRQHTVLLSDRQKIRELIGFEAEELTYLFGAHVKDHFWSFLETPGNYEILDRFTGQTVPISKKQVSQLVTLTLANWLEQRPRVDKKYQFLRQEEFCRSKEFLPPIAYGAFQNAYNLQEGDL